MKVWKKLVSFRGIFPCLLLFMMISPKLVFAATGGSDSVLGGLAEILGVLISVLTFIALLMIKYFGQLLGTMMLTGPEAMQALTPMWVWVRNLTNIVFVIVLVGLAFSNLFASFSGENGGNWTIKEKLPKIIISLVAINFSLLAFRVVIDAVNVGTVAILGIADSRLDAEDPNQESIIANSKTWTIVTDDKYQKFKGEGKIVEYSGSDEVHGGNSCNEAYRSQKNNLGNGRILGYKGSKYKYICRDFRSQVNDVFCSGWENKHYDDDNIKSEDLDDDCLFMLKKSTFKTMLNPDDEPGQNLFMSFGTVFMHLEKMPALAAKIDSINGLILNSLFSGILSLAYLASLAAIFIALLGRILLLWIAMVFSPLLIAASIMGIEKASEGTTQIVTNLIMPLKIAAAFAVSFVMMSGMIDFNVINEGDSFLFGPALSNLGIGGIGFLWQIATIVIFWKVAKWAVDGNLAHSITDKIFTGAETLGEYAAKAATINRQVFGVKVDGKEKKFSLSNIMAMPSVLQRAQLSKQSEGLKNMREALGIDMSKMEKFLADKSLDTNSKVFTEFRDILKKFSNKADMEAHKSQLLAMLDRSNAPFARDIAKAIREEGSVAAGWDKVAFTSNAKSQLGDSYTKSNGVDNPNFYKGFDGATDTKENPAKNSQELAKGNTTINKDATKLSITDGGATIDYDLSKFKGQEEPNNLNNTQENHLDDLNLSSTIVDEISDKYNSNEAQNIIQNLAKKAQAINGIDLTKLKNREKMEVSLKDKAIFFKEKDSSNKVQAVYIADRKSGTPMDLSKFGASGVSNGKVDFNTAKTIYNYQLAQDADSETKAQFKELQDQLAEAYGADKLSSNTSVENSQNTDNTTQNTSNQNNSSST